MAELPFEEIRRQDDLADLELLVQALKSCEEGMLQQSNAAKQGTALGGHPYPSQFYEHVARVLAAACAKIEPMVKKEPPKPEPKSK